MNKKWQLLIVAAVILVGVAGIQASTFAVKNYLFGWDAAKEGNVRLRIEKSPQGVKAILASPGGRLARIEFDPSLGKALGEALLKAEEFRDRHQRYYEEAKTNKKYNLNNKELTDTEKLNGHEVLFYSEPQGKSFTVKFKQDKMMSSMVLFKTEEAMVMGRYLLDLQEMAAHIDTSVTP